MTGQSDSGYIRLPRDIGSLAALGSAAEKWGFVWLILQAAVQDQIVTFKNQRVDLNRGQLCLSATELASELGWERTRAWRFLKRLENKGVLTIDQASRATGLQRVCNGSATAFFLVTICRYDDFSLVSFPSATGLQRVCNGSATGKAKIPSRPTAPSAPSVDDLFGAETDRLPRARRARPQREIPADWLPSDTDRQFALSNGVTESRIELMAEHFLAYHATKATLTADVSASWRTWVLNDKKFRAKTDGQDDGSRNAYGGTVLKGYGYGFV